MNLSSKNDDDGVQDYEIADLIQHPDFNSSSLYNDISLIKLSSEIKLVLLIIVFKLTNDLLINNSQKKFTCLSSLLEN